MLTEIGQITHNSLSNSIIHRIKQYIIDNELKSGDQLPSELVLCTKLGISRASIREALKVLEGSGIIQTIHGKGRFIREFNYDQMLDNLTYSIRVHFHDFREVVQVRMGLEAYFLPKAMYVLKEEDYESLADIFNEMEKRIKENKDELDLVEIHTMFHQRLYQAFDNKLLNSLISVFASFQRVLSVTNFARTSDKEQFLKKHWEILEALRHNNADAVSNCLKTHFSDYEHLGAYV